MSSGCEIHLAVRHAAVQLCLSQHLQMRLSQKRDLAKEETERKWHTGQSFSISLPISCVITAAFDGLLTAGTFLCLSAVSRKMISRTLYTHAGHTPNESPHCHQPLGYLPQVEVNELALMLQRKGGRNQHGHWG